LRRRQMARGQVPKRGSRPAPRKGVFACPGYNKVRGVYQSFSQGATGAYAYNANTGGLGLPGARSFTLLGLGNTIQDVPPVRENEIVSPSQMIAIGDSPIVNPVGMRPQDIIGLIEMPLFMKVMMSE